MCLHKGNILYLPDLSATNNPRNPSYNVLRGEFWTQNLTITTTDEDTYKGFRFPLITSPEKRRTASGAVSKLINHQGG